MPGAARRGAGGGGGGKEKRQAEIEGKAEERHIDEDDRTPHTNKPTPSANQQLKGAAAATRSIE